MAVKSPDDRILEERAAIMKAMSSSLLRSNGFWRKIRLSLALTAGVRVGNRLYRKVNTTLNPELFGTILSVATGLVPYVLAQELACELACNKDWRYLWVDEKAVRDLIKSLQRRSKM